MNIRYNKIKNTLFINNRKNFAKKMKKNSVAIFCTNYEMHRNGDCNFPFRPDSDFFYLTGINQEKSILVLVKTETIEETLFILQSDEHLKIWEGEKFNLENASEISGIKNVQWLGNYEGFIKNKIIQNQHIYINYFENDRHSLNQANPNTILGNELKKQFPAHQFHRSAPILKQLRCIKSSSEIKIIQQACDITHKAFINVLQNIKPGMIEYEIEAEISYIFTKNGATAHAYSPIVASGKNACVLHYIDNNNVCKNGDLILMDFGAEYAYYAADLTRTIPVNGKFTKRQKEVYTACLNVFKYAKSIILPRLSWDEYNKKIGIKMTEELFKIGLIDSIELQNPLSTAFRKYFMHGTSHFLGLDVHDVGDRSKNFKVGMLITCEPGIYIPNENIGIRIENDLLITKNGVKDLMENIPIEIEDIEKWMKKKP
jgi:Xaa-Pro aminopeptidase